MNKIFKWPGLIIGIITVLTIIFALQLPNIKLNNDVKIFLPANDPSKVANNKMEETYGSSDIIDVAVKVENQTLLTRKNIKELKSITDDLEKIKNIDEVTSLTNADYIEGTSEGMKVNSLVNKLPDNEQDLFKIKEKLISWDLYKNNLYTSDFKATQISVKLVKDLSIKQKEQVYFAIKKALHKYEGGNLGFYIAGSPAVNVLMGDDMESDLQTLIPFVILIVILALYLSFRNFSGVLLPMLTVLVSTIWALGIMSLFKISLTIVSTVIPVLLVAVGSAYGIHIISHYYDELRKSNKKLSKKDHYDLVLQTIKKVGRPVFLAGLTTIVGFGSLTTSNIVPIKQFGIFTAIGVATAVLVAVTLIPAILLLRNKNRGENTNEIKESRINKIILFLYHYFGEKRIRILLLALIIVIVAGYGMSRIVTDSIMIQWFKENTDIRQADKYINNNFAGDNILNVLITGPGKGSLTDPEILNKMDDLGQYLQAKYKQIGKVTSFADYIKRMNKVMNYPQEGQDTAVDNTGSAGIEENTTNFTAENTSNFGENTSSFAGEESSNFGGDNASSSLTENTSNFAGESTSNFGQSEEEQPEAQQQEIGQNSVTSQAPSQMKMSEQELLTILNRAIVKAKKTNLSGEELVEAVNRELNYKGEAYNEIPTDPAKYPVKTKDGLKNLISQYLLMYSGNLDDLINNQIEPSGARMTLQIKTGSNIMARNIKKDIKKYVSRNFPEGYRAEVAGHVDMALSVNNLIVFSQIKSILASLLIVFLIVAIDYKSVIAGFYGIIPLGISVLINFGIMGFAGIKLDIGTSMVASLAIGIGVDYTVHFLSAYYNERKESSDLNVVCQNTMLSSGKAIIFNALSVAAGFAVLLLSNFNPLASVGLLVAITMLTSSLASMTILPALLNLFKPKFISK